MLFDDILAFPLENRVPSFEFRVRVTCNEHGSLGIFCSSFVFIVCNVMIQIEIDAKSLSLNVIGPFWRESVTSKLKSIDPLRIAVSFTILKRVC